MARDVLTVEEEPMSGGSEREGSSGDSGDEGNLTRVSGTEAAAPAVAFHSAPKQKKMLKKVKKLTKKERSVKRKAGRDLDLVGLVRPDASTDKEKERLLRRIATKGVVQLFNAVADRQSTMSKELKKKMTAKERKETERKLRGENFTVGPKSNKKVKNEDDDDENMDESVVKEEEEY